MYFGKKNDTSIDNEFKDKKNILSHILNFLSNKVVLIGLVLIIVLILTIVLFINKKVEYYLTLNGENIITIYQGTDYVEPGYEAYNSKDEDLTTDVLIDSNLNNDIIGEYEITYTLGDITETRIVNVIAKPQEYIFIYLNTINNNVNVYLKKGETYTEPGYQVFSSTGTNLTNEVTVTGEVDTSKKGTYKLIYSVIDSNNVTVSASRTVIVIDSELSLTLENSEYTNKEVTINASVIDEYFDYMILPDNTKVTTSTYSYKVSKNGKYTFKAYSKKGSTKESTIEVKNIDKVAPSGSCSGSYKDGVSTINVQASDNIGINRYVINGNKYTSNIITINSELTSVNITIYDNAGNNKDINCNLEDKNEKVLFDKNITYSYEYVYKSNGVSYALYTPSTASSQEKVPLIIWLHGSGTRGTSKETFRNKGLIGIIDDWDLENFNAYIFSPHISKETTSSWGSGNIKEKLWILLEEIVATKNIDPDKIILSGHSMGGIGVYDVANTKSHYFSAFVVMSGYNTNTDLNQYKSIPIKGYVGTPEEGEDSSSYKHMVNGFVTMFGEENLTIFNTSHGKVPSKAFNEDKDNNNRSDLIEWMLAQ